jgi:hypothetical protein
MHIGVETFQQTTSAHRARFAFPEHHCPEKVSFRNPMPDKCMARPTDYVADPGTRHIVPDISI